MDLNRSLLGGHLLWHEPFSLQHDRSHSPMGYSAQCVRSHPHLLANSRYCLVIIIAMCQGLSLAFSRIRQASLILLYVPILLLIVFY